MVKRLLIGLLVAVGIIGLGLGLQYIAPPNNPQPTESQETPTQNPPADNTPVGIEDTVVGQGAEVKVGDTVLMHYRGTLTDGTQFDSSYDRGEPLELVIAPGRVIQGWIEGIPGMKVGGKRTLKIPSSKGYGEAGNPPKIPPNADLLFDVELVEIK